MAFETRASLIRHYEQVPAYEIDEPDCHDCKHGAINHWHVWGTTDGFTKMQRGARGQCWATGCDCQKYEESA